MVRAQPKWLEGVVRGIWRRFPEFDAVEPSIVSRQLMPKTAAAQGRKVGDLHRLHTLTFCKSFSLGDGVRTTRIVRVVADDDGRILKVICNR